VFSSEHGVYYVVVNESSWCLLNNKLLALFSMIYTVHSQTNAIVLASWYKRLSPSTSIKLIGACSCEKIVCRFDSTNL